MNQSKHHPASRFEKIDLSEEEFKSIGYKLIDSIAALNRSMRSRAVTTQAPAAAIASSVREVAGSPLEGKEAIEVFENVMEVLFHHSLFNGHPKFWGYITSSPAPVGVLADLLASAVNPNLGAWVLSPAGTEIEKQTVQWVGEFMGYPGQGGLLVSGGNMANFVCFLAAMRAKAGSEIRTTGLRGLPRHLVAYCSAETHTWIQKAADLSGIGTGSIRWIDTDGEGRMNPAILEKAIQADLDAGAEPFIVVGTGGSVSTGVVDSLADLADICKRYSLWFHVDGAYGGFAAALPELTGLFAGLAQADSVAVDPHKWLYAPLEAGCALVKTPQHLLDTFAYLPPYYNMTQDVTNYVHFGPQNSRGFRALKVWLSFQHLGFEGHRRLIREDILLAQYAFGLFKRQEDFEVFSCHLSIATFRYVPLDVQHHKDDQKIEAYLNDLNKTLLNRIGGSGEYFLSNAVLKGRYVLRLCIVNFRTTPADIEGFPAFVRKLGEEIHGARYAEV